MAEINSIEIQKFLSGVNYPATKEELLAHAEEEGADDALLSTLAQLPNKSYETPADVSLAMGSV